MASHGVTRTVRTRTEEQRLQDLEKIKKYRHLETQIRTQVATGTYTLDLFELTTKLLRQNPEYYTIWNIRRHTKNQDSDSQVLQSEIAFTMPLLLEFPKCYWIWNFRQWLLAQAIQRLPLPVARKIWETELSLLESSELDGKSMAEEEFAYTTKMIRQSLSNFSAWHNRSQLIPKVLEQRGADDKARAAFLGEELDLVRDALNVGPEDQSLWYYHQFLVSQIVGDGNKPSITPALTVDEKIAYLKHEIDEIKDLLEDYADIKWIYEALSEYAVALERLQSTGSNSAEAGDLQVWLSKLRTLDPMRTGRWNDVEQLAT
ncbi:protein prenyltransferase alpha subunit repeat domain-containing protein [Trichoderma breve]|uniref:Geranylgeranyl transferase type-2 subunit alpha n=1 Tax=Trichoderma breve TaxID=2034170 RepID=A0A9W9E7U1_9HYPO|nr:protein prenyltransferase alpha subunit repeat domain-containing protein [Trichoderma breve]KAJ4857811.1 protein prenyltransferase alpha subunit repeat domain-containing protein [Trichoderma breve]